MKDKMTIERFDANTRMCDMVATESLVFISGQVPTTLDAPVATQTVEVLSKLDAMLERAGSDKAHLLTATIYLRDFRDYAEFNHAWDKWVDTKQPPARDCFKVELANPGWKVEIVATALRIRSTSSS